MKKRCLLAGFLFAAASMIAYPAAAVEEVDLELVFAADGSGSIDDEEFRLQRAGYAAAMSHPRVLNAIRSGYHQKIAVAFVEWGAPESQHTIIDWMVIDGPAAAKVFAGKLLAAPRAAWGYNSISGAVDYAAGLIRSNDYEGERKVIDVSGDGPQIGGRPMAQARYEAVSAGITINALVVNSPNGGFPSMGPKSLEAHYRNEVIGGMGAFTIVARNREEFANAILRKMIHEIAGTPEARRLSLGGAGKGGGEISLAIE